MPHRCPIPQNTPKVKRVTVPEYVLTMSRTALLTAVETWYNKIGRGKVSPPYNSIINATCRNAARRRAPHFNTAFFKHSSAFQTAGTERERRISHRRFSAGASPAAGSTAKKQKAKKNTMELVLHGEPNPRQREFFLSRARHTAYGGARGGGKSWAMRRKFVLLAFRYPGLRLLL